MSDHTECVYEHDMRVARAEWNRLVSELARLQDELVASEIENTRLYAELGALQDQLHEEQEGKARGGDE